MIGISFQITPQFALNIADEYKNTSAYAREASEHWIYVYKIAKKLYAHILTPENIDILYQIIHAHPTPLFIYSKNILDTLFDDFIAALTQSNTTNAQIQAIQTLKASIKSDLDALLISFLIAQKKIPHPYEQNTEKQPKRKAKKTK